MLKKYAVKMEVHSNFKINKKSKKIIKKAFTDLNRKIQINDTTKNISFNFNNIEEILDDAFVNEKLLDYIVANGEITINNDENNDDILYKICDDRLSLFSVNYIKSDNIYILVLNEMNDTYNIDFIISDIKVID